MNRLQLYLSRPHPHRDRFHILVVGAKKWPDWNLMGIRREWLLFATMSVALRVLAVQARTGDAKSGVNLNTLNGNRDRAERYLRLLVCAKCILKGKINCHLQGRGEDLGFYRLEADEAGALAVVIYFRPGFCKASIADISYLLDKKRKPNIFSVTLAMVNIYNINLSSCFTLSQ